MPSRTPLTSFAQPIRALVFGARGGIGGALVANLAADPGVAEVIAAARAPLTGLGDRVRQVHCDITDEASLVAAVAGLGDLDLVIVATGLLHSSDGLQPEKTWRALAAEPLARAFLVNTIGPALIAKHTLPLLPRGRRAIFAALSARVGSIGDNQLGGWYGYRAAKAALNQILRTAAIELAAKRPLAVCVGLHPGTVATDLSAPFRGHVPEGKLFTPGEAASQLLHVLDALTPADTGRVFAWDGSVVPP